MREPCAICGMLGSAFSPTERTYPVEFTLRDMGVEGKYAHISCLGAKTEERHERKPMPPNSLKRQSRFFVKS